MLRTTLPGRYKQKKMIETVKQKEAKAFKALKGEFNLSNVMQTPKLEKVTLSVGIGKIKDDKRKVELIEDRLEKISGQKISKAAAKKSIATFKVREGETTGLKVTLRGKRMYEFLDKYINISIPRTKDFRGINPKSIDEMGNLTMGIKEHIIFPETGDEEIRDIFGLSVTINTTATDKKLAKEFLSLIGVPFKKEEVK